MRNWDSLIWLTFAVFLAVFFFKLVLAITNSCSGLRLANYEKFLITRYRWGGEVGGKCLSRRCHSALQEKQNQFSTTQRTHRAASAACGHFDIFLRFFLLASFLAFCCVLQLENSSCATLALHEKPMANWNCWSHLLASGRGWAGGRCRESEVLPRPASALHHHFARPSKWNVKLNGNNFDWIFLYTGYGWQKFEGNAVASRGVHDWQHTLYEQLVEYLYFVAKP